MGECEDEGHGCWSWFPGLSFGREKVFFFFF
jgi:hypothetical protein